MRHIRAQETPRRGEIRYCSVREQREIVNNVSQGLCLLNHGKLGRAKSLDASLLLHRPRASSLAIAWCWMIARSAKHAVTL